MNNKQLTAATLVEFRWKVMKFDPEGEVTTSYHYGEEPYLQQLQDWVQGDIELFPNPDESCDIYVNELGAINGMPLNEAWEGFCFRSKSVLSFIPMDLKIANPVCKQMGAGNPLVGYNEIMKRRGFPKMYGPGVWVKKEEIICSK